MSIGFVALRFKLKSRFLSVKAGKINLFIIIGVDFLILL